jgi:excisionase family DNA binding protein
MRKGKPAAFVSPVNFVKRDLKKLGWLIQRDINFRMIGRQLMPSITSSTKSFSHSQIFDHLKNSLFSADEAAQYLEVSMPTFRRYVQAGKLKPTQNVGRNQLFSSGDLRRLKQKIRD